MTRAEEQPRTVGAYMTPCPHCVSVDDPLARAQALMRELQVRHLPVRDGSLLVGVLSERHMALIGTFAPDQLDTTPVGEAMAPIPYCVTADTPLSEVTNHMATRKLGSAVVVEGNDVIGLFTTSDALRALSQALDSPVEGGAPSQVKTISLGPAS